MHSTLSCSYSTNNLLVQQRIQDPACFARAATTAHLHPDPNRSHMGLAISRLWSLFSLHKDVKIVMVGLDAAGKTTILYKLKLGELVSTIPTIGFNMETVQYKNISFLVQDIGGQERIRRLWHHYFAGSHAIIYVVDSNDRERIVEAKQELQGMLSEPDLQNASLLVFANKQDLPMAMSVAEVTEGLGLPSLHGRKWFVQSTCATAGEGLYEGLDWLAANLPSSQ